MLNQLNMKTSRTKFLVVIEITCIWLAIDFIYILKLPLQNRRQYGLLNLPSSESVWNNIQSTGPLDQQSLKWNIWNTGLQKFSSFYRETLWKENNYNSRNIVLNEDDDDESVEESSGEEEEERLAIEYVKGDVTQPINNTGNPAIIVHCVGE